MAIETIIAAGSPQVTQANRVAQGASARAGSASSPSAVARADAAAKPSFQEQTARAAGQAIYFSPRIKFDREAQELIIQFRNQNTGETTRQYPSPEAIKAYSRTQEQNADFLGPLASDTGAGDTGSADAQQPSADGNVVALPSAPAAPPAPRKEVPVSSFGNPQGGRTDSAYAFGSYAQISGFRNPFGSPMSERAVA